jgi:HEPN domain-containing protein
MQEISRNLFFKYISDDIFIRTLQGLDMNRIMDKLIVGLRKVKLFFYKKKFIEVKPEEKESEVTVLIQDGFFFLCAAKELFNHPFHMFAGAVLSHHGIELTLKACWIWDKNKYIQTHNLVSIANRISFLKANKKMQDLITKINTYYYFRYPMEEKTKNKIQKQLDRMGDKVHDIPTLAGELSTIEWEKVEEIYDFIVEAMPKDLYDLWEKITSKYRG